jgi:hypothetical protein
MVSSASSPQHLIRGGLTETADKYRGSVLIADGSRLGGEGLKLYVLWEVLSVARQWSAHVSA